MGEIKMIHILAGAAVGGLIGAVLWSGGIMATEWQFFAVFGLIIALLLIAKP
jgi:hypothetical protein